MKSRKTEFFQVFKKVIPQNLFLRHKLNYFRKYFSLTMVGVFLLSLVWIHPVKGAISYESEVNFPAKTLSLQLPSELARIQLFNSQGSGPLLVHIQTAHGNYGAQKKIEAILHHLHRRYGFKLLLLEGSASKFHPELLELFRGNSSLTMEVLDRLAKKALVKAPELYLAQVPETEAYGIESLDSYLRNGQALRILLNKRSELENFLANLKSGFQVLSGRYLNYELQQFIKRLNQFETSKNPNLIGWAVYLKGKAEKVLDLDLSQPESQIEWPMLLRITKLIELERGMDVLRLSREKEAFLGKIKPLLTPGVYQEIRSLFSSPFSKSLSRESYTRPLFEKMVSSLPENFDYDAFPQSKVLIAYLVLQSELEGERLLFEIDRLESFILETLAKTEEEKKLLSLFKDLRLLEKLFRLELTSEDHEKLKKRKNSLSPFRMIHRLLKLDRTQGMNGLSFDSVEEINFLFKQALFFYEGTQERDRHMLQNIESLLKESGQTKALIVTGGFHSAPFKNYFTRLGYRYALVTPRLTSTEGGDAYVTSILRYSAHETPGFLGLKIEDLEKHGFDPWRIRSEVRNEVSRSLSGYAQRKDFLGQYLESNYENEFRHKEPRAETRTQTETPPKEDATASYRGQEPEKEFDERAFISDHLEMRRQRGESIGADNMRPIGRGAYYRVLRQQGDRWVYKYSKKLGWRNEFGDHRDEEEFSRWLNQHGNLAAVTEVVAKDGETLLIRQEVGLDLEKGIETAIRRKRPDIARSLLKAFFQLQKKLFSIGVIVLDGKLDNFLLVERKDGIHVVLNDFHQAMTFDPKGKLMNGVDIFSDKHPLFQSYLSYFLYYFWYIQVKSKAVESGRSSLLAQLFSEEFQKSKIMPELDGEMIEEKIMREIQEGADKGGIKRQKVWQILQAHTESIQESLRTRLVEYLDQSFDLYGPLEGVETLTEFKTLSYDPSRTGEETVDYHPPGVLPPLETASPSKTPDLGPEKNRGEQLRRIILHDIPVYSPRKVSGDRPSEEGITIQRNTLRGGGAFEGKLITWRPSYLAALRRDLKRPLANVLIDAKWTEKFYEHPRGFYLLFSLLVDLAEATDSKEPLVTFIWSGGFEKDPYRIIHERLQNRTSGLGPLDRVVVNHPSFMVGLKKLIRFIDSRDKAEFQKYLNDNKEVGIASLASNPQYFSPDVLQFILDDQGIKDGDMPAASSLVIRLIQIATLTRSKDHSLNEVSLEIAKLIRELIPGAKPDSSGRNYFVIAFEEYIQSLLTFDQAFEISA